MNDCILNLKRAEQLYQPNRLPFGVTNGVACLQINISEFIDRHSLKKTYAYLDDVTVAGKDQAEHDYDLTGLLDACKKDNLQLNHTRSVFFSINYLSSWLPSIL